MTKENEDLNPTNRLRIGIAEGTEVAMEMEFGGDHKHVVSVTPMEAVRIARQLLIAAVEIMENDRTRTDQNSKNRDA